MGNVTIVAAVMNAPYASILEGGGWHDFNNIMEAVGVALEAELESLV